MMVISFAIEGMVWEEQAGHVNVYNTLLLHSARVWGHATTVLTPHASLHLPTYLPSPFHCGEKDEEVTEGKRELGVELP
jgi:hypothetical protein